MSVALLCSPISLERELFHTMLFRRDVERLTATRYEDARTMALAARPDVVLVDRDLPRAEALVTALREDPATRRLSIAVLARGDMEASELGLLQAGANAILRLSGAPGWDDRLCRLLTVPPRREARFPVQFAIEARMRSALAMALGLNLSVHGMLIEATVSLAVGDDLHFALRLVERGLAVAGRGRIVRQAGSTLYGVEFGLLEGDGAGQVSKFVDSFVAA